MIIRGPDRSPNCAECPMAVGGVPTNPVQGIGPEDPEWIALGMEPGMTELATGLPFVGQSGALFDKILRLTQSDRSKIWVTNAALCFKKGATDEEREQARVCCKPRLDEELARFPGKPVLAMGASAMRSMLESSVGEDLLKLSAIAGSTHEVGTNGTARPVVTTVHPALILRGGNEGSVAVDMLFWRMLYEVRKVKKLAAGDPSVRLVVDVKRAVDPDEITSLVNQLCESVERLKAAGEPWELGIDWETRPSTNAPRRVKESKEFIPAYWTEITALGLSTPEITISIAWGRLKAGTIYKIRQLLADPQVTKVIQNMTFDRSVGQRHGYPIADPCEDLMLAHHAAFPGMPHHLQGIVSQWWAVPPWKSEYRAGEDTPDNLLDYNGKDANGTRATFPKVAICVRQTQSEKVYEMDKMMAKLAMEMHLRGIPISKEENAELGIKFRADIKAADAEFKDIFDDVDFKNSFLDKLAAEQAKRSRKGEPASYEDRIIIRRKEAEKAGWQHNECPVDGENRKVFFGTPCPKCSSLINLNASDHIVAYLKAHGVPMWVMTTTGKVSTKQAVLDQLTHIDGVQPILKRKEAVKLLGTFVAPLPELVDLATWRLHVIWSPNKITGRFGSEAINCQNFPKKNQKGRPNLRKQFVAPHGRIFINADASQIEARMHGTYSCDPILVEVFTSGKDIHTEFCRRVWTAEKFDAMEPEKRKQLRDEIKQPEYGCLYGASDDTILAQIRKYHPKATMAQVTPLTTVLRKILVGVNAWHDELLREVARTGEVRDMFLGRRRCFPLGNGSVNDIWNFPIQCSSTALVNQAICRLWPHLKPIDAWIIIHGHDSILIDAPEDKGDQVMSLCREHLPTEVTHNGVTIAYPWDVKMGRSYADVT